MKFFLGAVLSLSIIIQTQAQNFWKPVNPNSIQLKSDQIREIIPVKYTSYQLDVSALSYYLRNAPTEQQFLRGDKIDMLIPMPNGELINYAVYEAPVMMSGLAAKYPSIKSYRGISSKNAADVIRFDIGPKGFHGAIRTTKGQIYLDPFANRMKDHYISYYTKDHNPFLSPTAMSCGVEDDFLTLNDSPSLNKNPNELTKNFQNDSIKLKVYRLALVCTGEWGVRQGGTVEDALADMNTSVNRLNLVFELDLSARVMLVNDNDQLVFVDPATDPFDQPRVGGSLLGSNTLLINNTIGLNSYDLGHIYTVGCSDTGGVAFRGSVCRPGDKGAGVTCHSSTNLLSETINIAAHEMGHQFGATHTWNSCSTGLDASGQHAGAAAIEPGSGSTIMSYAGICAGGQNVQGFNDDYFHVGSLEQMYLNLRSGTGNCAEEQDVMNTEPVISLDYENGFIIPMMTPFELVGSATDAENDTLLYNWEQTDAGPKSVLGSPMGTAPSFRSFKPNEDPKRVFPRLSRLLANAPESTEVLPTYSRELKFKFIVRDNHTGGGTAVWEEIRFNAIDSAGPFQVTYPNAIENLTIGDDVDITWDVANTDKAPIETEFVNIYLSTNGGFDFDYVLAEKAPNTGTASVQIPNLPGNNNRIKINATNSIYFDINNTAFSIVEPTEPTFILEARPSSNEVCLPTDLEIEINTAGFAGFDEQISLDVISEIPEGASYSFDKNMIGSDDSAILTVSFPPSEITSSLDLIIEAAPESGDTLQRTISLNLLGNDEEGKILATVLPVENNGVIGLPEFTWASSPTAQSYVFELATNPSFGDSNLIFVDGLSDTTFISTLILEKSTLYYWRAYGVNSCGNQSSTQINTLHTEVLSCKDYEAVDLPINISQSGLPTIESDIDIFDEGEVRDINIHRVEGLHNRVSDLKVSLIAPSGESVVLFQNKCGNLTNYNLGFDDDAPNTVKCPLTGGVIYKPQDSLARLNGQSVMGEWILRVEDTEPGAGGDLSTFSMELCSNVNLDSPFLVNNNRLEIPPAARSRIDDLNLLVEDGNNTAEELIYTLIYAPKNGVLNIDDTILQTGDQFTQQEINDIRFRYEHDGGDSTSDEFVFTVVDGEGGWIDKTVFEIAIDEDFSSSTEELELNSSRVKLFPNPTSDLVNITIEKEGLQSVNIQVKDVQGRIVINTSEVIKPTLRLNTSALSEGIYFVQFRSEDFLAVKKLIIQ